MGMAMKRYWDDENDDENNNDYGTTTSQTNDDNLFQQKNYIMTWEAVWLLSISFLILSGVLAVLASGCCCWGEGREKGSQQLVQISNIIFLSATIVQMLSTFADPECHGCFLREILVIASYVMWSASGVLWIIADAIMLPRDRDGGGDGVILGQTATSNNNMDNL